MGRQIGLIKVSGNIGGVSFYRSNGKDLARVANGPSKEKIQNGENFARTRENNSEFGGSSRAAKALRMAFANGVQTMADNRLVSRLTALFKEICSKGKGIRGQRSITVSDNRSVLENLEFNKKVPFSSVFNVPCDLTISGDRATATLDATNFSPQTYIKAPAGATHFKVIMSMGVISDYEYSTSTGKYEAVNAADDKLTKADAGKVTPVKTSKPENLNLSCALPGAATLGANDSVVLCLGIEFYQQVDKVDYLLSQGCSMKVISVF